MHQVPLSLLIITQEKTKIVFSYTATAVCHETDWFNTYSEYLRTKFLAGGAAATCGRVSRPMEGTQRYCKGKHTHYLPAETLLTIWE